MKPNVETDLCTDLTVTWRPESELELQIRGAQGDLVLMSKMEAERLVFFIQDRLGDEDANSICD